MTRIKYSVELMKFMALFENVTKAGVKNCFFDDHDQLFFIVENGEIGKAVGKKGRNVKKIQNMIKRKFRIVEFNEDVLEFIKNLVYPLRITEIEMREGTVEIKGLDTKTKGLLIGRNALNIRNYEKIVKRYFDVGGLKVI